MYSVNVSQFHSVGIERQSQRLPASTLYIIHGLQTCIESICSREAGRTIETITVNNGYIFCLIALYNILTSYLCRNCCILRQVIQAIRRCFRNVYLCVSSKNFEVYSSRICRNLIRLAVYRAESHCTAVISPICRSIWRYDALRDNTQAEPVNIVANVEMNGRKLGQRTRTYSVRSINECLLGYNALHADGHRSFVSTRLFFAAYVNEENPLIDKVLREALNTRIVRRFLGYQSGTPEAVDKQVYALWHVLQKRNFKYSSVSNTSLSSNVVYSQRVRTFEDALNASQINCVDGSTLFASLLRAINITPVLVQMPGHMFVGYYRDKEQKDLTFLETTMIGDVDLDDYFPEERLDSTMRGRTQGEMSKLTFSKSKEYANREYLKHKKDIRANRQGYMFVEISKAVRAKIQPIGR